MQSFTIEGFGNFMESMSCQNIKSKFFAIYFIRSLETTLGSLYVPIRPFPRKKLPCPPAGDVADTIERARETIPLNINRVGLRDKGNSKRTEAQQ